MVLHKCGSCGEDTKYLYPSADYFRRHNVPLSKRRKMKQYCSECWKKVSGDMSATGINRQGGEEIKTLRGFAKLSETERKIYVTVSRRFPSGGYPTAIAKACGYKSRTQVMPLLSRMMKKGALMKLQKGYRIVTEIPEETTVYTPTMFELRLMQMLAMSPQSSSDLVEVLDTSKNSLWVIIHRLKKENIVENTGGSPALYSLTAKGRGALEENNDRNEFRELLRYKFIKFTVKEDIKVEENWELKKTHSLYEIPSEQFVKLIQVYGEEKFDIIKR